MYFVVIPPVSTLFETFHVKMRVVNECMWGEFIVSFTHDLSVSSGSNSKVLAFFSKLSSGAGEQLSLGGDWVSRCDPGCNYMVHSFHGDMVEISSENDEFFKMEQVKIDWGRWKKWILGPKVDTNSALMWLLHGRDAKSKPQHGVSSGSNIAPSQDTASPWHAESRISQDHETNQSPRQSIAVAGVFIAMPSCLDPAEVVGIGRWWARRFGRPAQNEGLPQMILAICQVLLCSYGSLPISVVSLDLNKMWPV